MLQRAAHQDKWGLHDNTLGLTLLEINQQGLLENWLELRRKLHPQPDTKAYPSLPHKQAQDCLVYFSSFQDDITAIALGSCAARDDTDGVARILKGKYGVSVSTKNEAAKDFDGVFTSIGATYNLSNPSDIVSRPRTEKLDMRRCW